MYNLYSLKKEFSDLSSMLDNAGSDEEAVQAIQNTMEGISGTYEDIVEDACKLIRNIESDYSAIEEEIDRLKKRIASKQKQVSSVKTALRDLFLLSGKDKLKTPLFTLSIVIGSKRVEITDQAKLPDDYVRVKTTTEPDKVAIKAAIDAGIEVEGAIIVIGEPSLRIK